MATAIIERESVMKSEVSCIVGGAKECDGVQTEWSEESGKKGEEEREKTKRKMREATSYSSFP